MIGRAAWAAGLWALCLSTSWAQTTRVEVANPSGGINPQFNPANGVGGGFRSPLTGGRQNSNIKSGLPDSGRPRVEASRSRSDERVADFSLPQNDSRALPERSSPVEKAPADFSTEKTPAVESLPAGAMRVTADHSPAADDAGKRPAGASTVLRQADREIAVSRKGGGGEMGVHRSLQQIFDVARPGSSDQAGAPGVAGAFSGAQMKVMQTVKVANGASPDSAPGLYRSALETAEDAFSPDMAGVVSQSILGSARQKAATALPGLAEEAYRAAEAGASKTVEKISDSFSSWELLLGSPGKPLVSNMNLLWSDVNRTLQAALKNGSPETASSESRPVSLSARERDSSALVDAVSDVPRRVWFRYVPAQGSFMAMLPPSVVAPIRRDLAEGFALASLSLPLSFEEEILKSFRANPAASNGAMLVFRYHRGAGAGFWESVRAAAAYWFMAVWESIRQSWRGTVGVGAEARAFEQAETALSSAEGETTLRSARSAVAAVSRLAAAYEDRGGDDSPSKAAASIGRRIETGARALAIEDWDVLPDSLSRLVTSGRSVSLRYWLERMKETSVGGGESASGMAVEFSGPADLKLRAARIERLLSDVKFRSPQAKSLAGEVQSREPSPSRYATIGRAGQFLVQTVFSRRDSRWFTVMRDAEFGHLAFARADR